MFEGPVTGNIPEVLDNGEVTDGTHVTAGQLALALTPYAQVADLAVNTAASGNKAAAIQSLDDRVTAELASKLASSALAPAIAPLATAAALATTDGQVAAHGSSIAALQSSLTTGLSNKADQSAFDVLEGVVATKSTPDGVDLKLSNYSTTAAMNGSIASANNATLATVAANYGLKTVVDQHSLNIAARITPLEVDTNSRAETAGLQGRRQRPDCLRPAVGRGHFLQIRASAFGDGPAGRLAGPHGLGHSTRTHCAGQRGLRPAAVQRRELHGRVHNGRGRLGRSLLRSAHSHRHRRRSHADVHRRRVGQLAEHQRGGQRGPAELGHRNHRQHSHHQQHGQRWELHHGGRRVHGHADGLRRSNRSELRRQRGGHGRHADDHRGGLRGPAGLREPGLHLHSHERWSVDGQRGLRRRDELGHGLRAAALRVQHAHRDQHLRLLGRSLLDEELGGLEQAASVQQQRGLRRSCGCWATRA